MKPEKPSTPRKRRTSDADKNRHSYPWLSTPVDERPSFEDIPLGGPYTNEEGRAGLPVVCFVQSRKRLLDKDAAFGGSKFLLDALCYAGAIHDDSEASIRFTVEQEKTHKGEEEGTTIIIDYPDGYDLSMIGKAQWQEKKEEK